MSIKKIGEREGQERFVLIDSRTREVLTRDEASEPGLRRFFRQRGFDDALVEACFRRARERFDAEFAAASSPSADDGAETIEDTDLLFELGLGEDEDVH